MKKGNGTRIFPLYYFETPGHSRSISFYLKDTGIVISGDALFYGSIGRTDLPGGDYNVLIQSIKEKLLILPDETIVLPGHGPKTTIGFEKMPILFKGRIKNKNRQPSYHAMLSVFR